MSKLFTIKKFLNNMRKTIIINILSQVNNKFFIHNYFNKIIKTIKNILCILEVNQ